MDGKAEPGTRLPVIPSPPTTWKQRANATLSVVDGWLGYDLDILLFDIEVDLRRLTYCIERECPSKAVTDHRALLEVALEGLRGRPAPESIG